MRVNSGAGSGAEPETRDDAPERRPQMRPQLAGARQGLQRQDNPARGRHQAAFDETGPHRGFPRRRDRDRQEDAEEHARIDRAALPRKAGSRESGGLLGRQALRGHGALP
jgi:hypothetical protein